MKTNKNALFILINSGLNEVISIFFNIFFVAYIFNNIAGNAAIITVSGYFLVLFAVLFITYASATLFSFKTCRKKLYVLGTILKWLVILFVAIFYKQLNQIIYIVAIFNGIAEGLYWSTYNNLQYIVSKDKEVKKYIQLSTLVNKLLFVALPVLLGSIVDVHSFFAIIVLVLVVAAPFCVLSFFVKLEYKPKEALKFGAFVDKIKTTQNKQFFKDMWIDYFYNGILSILPTLVVYLTLLSFSKYAQLGLTISLFSLLSLIILLIFIKYFSDTNNNWYLVLISIFTIISISVVVLNVGITVLTIFNFAYSVLFLIPHTISNIRRCDDNKNALLKKYMEENYVFTELFLGAGRVLAYLAFLVVGVLNTTFGLYMLMLAISITTFLYLLRVYSSTKE